MLTRNCKLSRTAGKAMKDGKKWTETKHFSLKKRYSTGELRRDIEEMEREKDIVEKRIERMQRKVGKVTREGGE